MRADLQKTVATGALINGLGAVGRLLFPVFFLFVTRFFGEDLFGVFLVCFSAVAVAEYLSVGGINDGVVRFGAEVADEDREEFVRIIGNSLFAALAISLGTAALGFVLGPRILTPFYPDYDLSGAFRIMICGLPFAAITTVALAATRAQLMMQWEVLVASFIKPALLLALSIVVYVAPLEDSLPNLAACYVVTMVVCCFVSTAILHRYLPIGAIVREMLRMRFSAPLLKFAIPQNINMTFNHFITKVDVFMLGYFHVDPALVGFYGIGAEIVGNIKQVQTSFAGVLSPVIPRLFRSERIDELSVQLAEVSRWATTLAAPLTIYLLLFRTEILGIFSSEFTGDSTFMIYLAIRPVINCSVGMSGNVIVMTGHSLWNLGNSTVIAGLNTVLNYLWIPEYGLTGAALATMVSSTTVTLAQVFEMRFLTGVQVRPSLLYKPWIAIVPAVLAMVLLAIDSHTIFLRIAWALGILVSYALILRILGLEESDRKFFAEVWGKVRNKLGPTAT